MIEGVLVVLLLSVDRFVDELAHVAVAVAVLDSTGLRFQGREFPSNVATLLFSSIKSR